MSWEAINTILGLASVDKDFCQQLLQDPLKAIKQRQIVLTREEEAKLSNVVAHDLSEFSQQILVLFEQEEK